MDRCCAPLACSIPWALEVWTSCIFLCLNQVTFNVLVVVVAFHLCIEPPQSVLVVSPVGWLAGVLSHCLLIINTWYAGGCFIASAVVVFVSAWIEIYSLGFLPHLGLHPTIHPFSDQYQCCCCCCWLWLFFIVSTSCVFDVRLSWRLPLKCCNVIGWRVNRLEDNLQR